MDTRFGTLQFDGGGFPTPETAQRLYDEMDLQRATQAFMDFFPHMSLYAIIRSQARDLGFETSSDIGVMADFMNTNQPFLTGNNSTIYAVASIDLKEDGPTVVEIPPGMYGTANDAAFRYLTDFGATGPTTARAANTCSCRRGMTAMSPMGISYCAPTVTASGR
ncbi:MAG: DUF1254 domain-containing protein [Rhodobacteraceae bacterium]|nr:DUF1254 domain-containing protein [Paracoccaceae bacterium]